MTQQQFGKLVGLSRRTVQSVELGILRLSERAAHRISEEIGVDVYWLLENRLEEPIQNRWGQPWNLEWFQVARLGLWRGGYLYKKAPVMQLFKTYRELRWIVAERDLADLVRDKFLINLQKAVADLWETIPDRDERNQLIREHREERLSDEELLQRVIADARDLLAAVRDREKRTKSKAPRRPRHRKPVDVRPS